MCADRSWCGKFLSTKSGHAAKSHSIEPTQNTTRKRDVFADQASREPQAPVASDTVLIGATSITTPPFELPTAKAVVVREVCTRYRRQSLSVRRNSWVCHSALAHLSSAITQGHIALHRRDPERTASSLNSSVRLARSTSVVRFHWRLPLTGSRTSRLNQQR